MVQILKKTKNKKNSSIISDRQKQRQVIKVSWKTSAI